jgi:hypothetical protein
MVALIPEDLCETLPAGLRTLGGERQSASTDKSQYRPNLLLMKMLNAIGKYDLLH